MGVMESRSDRDGGCTENLGDLRRLVPDVVAKDEDRALLRGEPPECPIQLVAIRDIQEVVRRLRTLDRENPEVGRPPSLATRLLDADVGEEPMDPRVETVRIAEVRQVSPGDHQRVLQGILGPVDIPEDSLGDREETVAARSDQVDERRLFASHGRLDEISIH